MAAIQCLRTNQVQHQFYHKLFIIGIALYYQQYVRISYMLK